MKSSDATTTNHPPLAHDAQGHPIAMPEGSAFWTLKRQTTGRPKTIMGPDRRAVRLPLDTTEREIADTYGPGTYRLDALDALGNPLDHVTTLVIGDEDAGDDDDEERSGAFLATRRNGNSELGAALATIAEITRAQSSALKAVAEAQADWVKGLASARALPRNAAFVSQQAQLPPPQEPDQTDEEDEEEDEPEPLPAYAVVAQAAQGIVQGLPAMMLQFSQMISAIAAARKAGHASTSPAAAPTGRNPMAHLAEINERLTGAERRFLSHVLRSQTADTLTQELLARSVDDAVGMIRDAIAQARSAREPAPPTGADAPPAPSAAPPDFMAHVAAIAMFLSPDERAEVMALAPRLKPARVEQLKNQLLAMTVDDAVAWIRQNLAALEAEVAS